MLTNELFHILSFPYRVHDTLTGVLICLGEGSLFSTPKYSADHELFFRSLKSDGWHVCPDGYAVYSQSLDGAFAVRLILHGLKVHNISTAHGKTEGLSIKLSAKDVSDYIGNFIKTLELANNHFSEMLFATIHEIRGINSALYNAAYQLSEETGSPLAKNITSLSELISARLELVAMLAEQGQEIDLAEAKPVPLFKKFDKISRCFMSLASKRGITLRLLGNSRGSVMAVANILEIIPLLIIDNAIKYSPTNNDVTICFNENSNFINCEVCSVGPVIDVSEQQFLFTKGFRGHYARSTGVVGNGIGLYFLRTLVNAFSGKVEIFQDSATLPISGSVPYSRTTFRLSFPRVI